jgi:hypothetical protein
MYGKLYERVSTKSEFLPVLVAYSCARDVDVDVDVDAVCIAQSIRLPSAIVTVP